MGATSELLPDLIALISFNSRTRVGATQGRQLYQQTKQFQFTHPCGCDKQWFRFPPTTQSFNSRTRVGATPLLQQIINNTTSFNSRTRVGATYYLRAVGDVIEVSIHAPVWVRPATSPASTTGMSFNSRTRVGATTMNNQIKLKDGVSIHAPVWVRPEAFHSGCPLPCFNSRTRVGATRSAIRNLIALVVSIHAPVWVRPQYVFHNIKHALFQFTHPCGCDMRPLPFQALLIRFNSRTRVGATDYLADSEGFNQVSIHAPVWVRRRGVPFWLSPSMFQFTHPCGCD